MDLFSLPSVRKKSKHEIHKPKITHTPKKRRTRPTSHTKKHSSCLRGLPLCSVGEEGLAGLGRQAGRREGRWGWVGKEEAGKPPRIGRCACRSTLPRPPVGCGPAALSFHLFGAPISSRCRWCCLTHSSCPSARKDSASLSPSSRGAPPSPAHRCEATPTEPEALT